MPAAPQITYSAMAAEKVAGALATSEPGRRIVSRFVEPVGGIPVGRFCTKGTSERQIDVIDAAGDIAKLSGVTLFDSMRMPSSVGWARYDAVPVLRQGQVWIEASAAIDEDDLLYITHTGADAGMVRGSADGTATIIPNGAAKCLKGGADGDLVLIEVNLP